MLVPDSRHDRITSVDALKAIACQVIVLHHLAFYGPMSRRVAALAPDLVAAFSRHGRLAVQVFLVLAGFLAARRLAPRGLLLANAPLAVLARRYARLSVPYFVVITLAVVASALARALAEHPSIPAPPTPAQLVAHVLLLQDILGFESLSAGFWYVAIDFQLFALLLAALWMGRMFTPGAATSPWTGPALVAALGVASLFVFNRNPALDVWAPYFFASYAMGAIAFWLSRRVRCFLWLVPLIVVVLAALAIDFRLRIAVAFGVALVLIADLRGLLPTQSASSAGLAYLARIAYCVFLVHFSVCLIVNAVWIRFLPPDPWVQILGILVAWWASIAAGAVLHRCVETRADRLLASAAGVARAFTAGIRGRLSSTPRADSGR